MVGEIFGKWTIVGDVESNKQFKRYLCRCDCGNIVIVMMQSLKSGNSIQCKECYRNRGHRKSKTSTYKIWTGLFTRCYNKNHTTYKYYGAKGILVDNEWRSYEKFLKDMGERPTDHQIDRIDITKGYYKDNCRWVSKQDNNRRQCNRFIDITGMKFGKWNVIDRDVTKLERDQVYWNCVCDCGKTQSVIGSMMRSGKTKQCLDCKHKSHSEIHSGWNKRKLK